MSFGFNVSPRICLMLWICSVTMPTPRLSKFATGGSVAKLDLTIIVLKDIFCTIRIKFGLKRNMQHLTLVKHP